MAQGKVVIVTGSRIFHPMSAVWRVLAKHSPDLVVTGACPHGADAFAEAWAKKYQVDYVGIPARWDTPKGYDKGAGYKRNCRMLRLYPDALVLGFPQGEARGTTHCLAEAEGLGMRTEVYDQRGELVTASGLLVPKRG